MRFAALMIRRDKVPLNIDRILASGLVGWWRLPFPFIKIRRNYGRIF